MKRLMTALCLAIMAAGASAAFAQDMRQTALEAREIKARTIEKARLENARAQEEAQRVREEILADERALKQAAADLKAANAKARQRIKTLKEETASLESERARLAEEVESMDSRTRELSGSIRSIARDADALIRLSPHNALQPGRGADLAQLGAQGEFPSMEAIESMAALLLEEIARNGEVRVETGAIVDREGREVQARILVIGGLSAAYSLEHETGFLLYSEESRRFFSLSTPPPPRQASLLRRYMDGEAQAAPLDITKGGALRQMTHEKKLSDRLFEGGPIVWIILGLAAAALILTGERLFFLVRKSASADKLMARVEALAREGQWERCLSELDAAGDKPVQKVLAQGVRHRNLDRMDLENALQEAILGEIPRLERFLSTLAMLAAVAPLLGLLGTVTGMINTFHVITYYGAGDPKMMSGGISEALVTTMLGLSAAIPIMLVHTLLSRKVERIIAQMEEKAVSLVNLIFSLRGAQ